MRLRTLSLVLALTLLAIPVAAEKKQPFVSGQVLVKYKSGFTPESGKHGVKKSKAAFGRFRLKGKAKQIATAHGLDRVHVLEVDDVRAAVERLSADPAVEYAEPNWILRFAAVPNDPSYATQWGLAKVGAPQAWDVATSGTGVVIGVVDTGIDLTHPDLAANLWTNPGEIAGNGIDDDANGFVDDVHGWDFGSDDNDPSDENGHGTAVAGVIGAVGNNAVGVSGVAWTAKLAALRVGNMTSSASVYAAVQAIEYANAMGFRITNNSYGWWEGGQSFLFDDVIEAAEAQGNLFVAGAGNDGHDNDQLPHYPSHYTNPNVLSVTSTTATDELSSFSNYGALSVDLGAPGSNIETTARGGGYTNVSGTSYAAPFVAGAAALYWTANPSLTAVQVRDAILLHTDPLPALNQTTVSGGRLSLANLFDSETAAPAAISDLTVLDATFRSVTLRFTATGDDGTTGRAARYDVRVSVAPLTESNWAQATQLAGEPIPSLPGTLETFRLTGLAASTTYHVGVRAIDNAGNAGALSNGTTFTTTRAAVLFDDNVEGGARDWTADGLWHISAGTWRYAKPGGNYDTGAANRGSLTSREFDLTGAVDARLQFRHDLWTQRTWGRDVARVQISVNGGAWQTVLLRMSTDYGFIPESIDLSSYAGQRVRVRFDFDTIDADFNNYPGWKIDDVRVEATSSNAPPVAILGAPTVTEDQIATFSSSGSSDPEGAALEYKWSFGDGTFAYTSSTSVTHTWTREGSYPLTLTAFDGSNASDPVTMTITPIAVNDRPVAGISMASAPAPHREETPITITYFNSSDEEGAPLTCRFDYGDGQTVNTGCSGTWPHVWPVPGTYTVTLIVNDGVQDSLPDTEVITIEESSNDKPIARAGGPYDARLNEAIALDGSASTDEETSVASFLWTFPDGTTATGAQPSKAFATSGNLDVSLVVTDATSVASTAATARVRVCGGATANFFGNPIFTCPGGTAKVGVNLQNAIPPLTLTWGDGFVQEIPSLTAGYYAERIVTPSTAPATYTLSSLTDFLACAGTVGSATATVQFAKATLQTYTATICRGASAEIAPQLTGEGPWTVTWSDGVTQTFTQAGGASRTVSPTETTAYSIVSMTCASCPAGTTGVTSGTVTVNPVDAVSGVLTGGGNACNGAAVPVTVTISGGAPPFQVNWSDGASTSTSTRSVTRYFNPATPMTYTATSVSSGSCYGTVSGSATVTPWAGTPPSVTDVLGGGTTCESGGPVTVTATLAGDGLPFTLTWSDGFVQTVSSLTATRSVDPAVTTQYSVSSIQNAFGCSGTVRGNVQVSRRPPPTATVTGGGMICGGDPKTISVALTGGAPFTITWSDGVTQNVSGYSATRSVSPSAQTTYTITALSDAYCSTGTSTGSATFTPAPKPTATVSGGGGYCAGGSATINVALTGTAPFQLTWFDGFPQTVPSGNVATRSVNPTSSTNYSIFSVSDAYCSGTASGVVSVYPRALPTATVSGGGTSCVGGAASVNASFTGAGPFTVTWSDGLTQSGLGTSVTRSVNPATTTTYTITSITDSFCTGTSTGSATVTPRTQPTAVVSGGGDFCPGGSAAVTATFTGTAPFTVTWSDGTTQTVPSGNVATRSVSPGFQATYSISSFRDAYCIGTHSGSATATRRSAPTATVSGSGTYCTGYSKNISASLSGTAPFTVTWSDGVTQTIASGSTAQRDVAPTIATTYTVTAVTDAFCSGTASGSATVTPSTPPTAVVSGGGSYCPGSPVTITAALSGTGPYNITWSDGFTQQVTETTATRTVSPGATTTYFIMSIANANCVGTASGSATVVPRTTPTAVVSGGGSYCEGATTNVTATLTGTAPFTLLWSDGVTQTTSSTTVTRAVGPSATTVYTLTSFTDAYCSSTPSGSATATPTLKPVITQQPQNKTIAKGTATTLTVVASGTGLNYQWYQGASGTTTLPVGTNSASFTTPKLRATTQYWVKIWKTGCASYPTNSTTATVTAQ